MIWITGASGMLGRDVTSLLHTQGYDLIQSDREVNIADMGALQNFIGPTQIKYIINCAAYTAVDAAENDAETAFAVNSNGVANLARIAREKNATLIHISTDYVFDGNKGALYCEDDRPNPLSRYGKSKLDGERLLTRLCRRYFLIRTSGLYGLHGANFVNTMLNMFSTQKQIRIVDDQKSGLTYTKDLAVLIGAILFSTGEYGIYHFSNRGCISWYEFGLEIYKKARDAGIVCRDVYIEPISAREFPLPAKRPAKSCMSLEKTEKTFGITAPHWRDALHRYLEEVINNRDTVG